MGDQGHLQRKESSLLTNSLCASIRFVVTPSVYRAHLQAQYVIEVSDDRKADTSWIVHRRFSAFQRFRQSIEEAGNRGMLCTTCQRMLTSPPFMKFVKKHRLCKCKRSLIENRQACLQEFLNLVATYVSICQKTEGRGHCQVRTMMDFFLMGHQTESIVGSTLSNQHMDKHTRKGKCCADLLPNGKILRITSTKNWPHSSQENQSSVGLPEPKQLSKEKCKERGSVRSKKIISITSVSRERNSHIMSQVMHLKTKLPAQNLSSTDFLSASVEAPSDDSERHNQVLQRSKALTEAAHFSTHKTLKSSLLSYSPLQREESVLNRRQRPHRPQKAKHSIDKEHIKTAPKRQYAVARTFVPMATIDE